MLRHAGRPLMSDAKDTDYRIDWWTPLACSPHEWAGNWDLAATAGEARELALSTIDLEKPTSGLVLLTHRSTAGCRLGRVVVDRAALEIWDTAVTELPSSDFDPAALPPLGREDIETLTLSRCREALLVARDAGLIEPVLVGAIVQIVLHAFAGVGPAVDLVRLAGDSATPRMLS